MKDLKTVTKAITHAGKFHTDDVISTAFLRYFNPNMEVTRVLEYEGTPSDDEIVFDIGMGEFDHHQEERRFNFVGKPFSAFGLLWEAYGRLYLTEQGFTNVDEAYQLFTERYVHKIDQGDNEGYKEVKGFYDNQLIIQCNPLWFENADEQKEMQQFNKAVELGKQLLEMWTRTIFKETQTHAITF